MSNREVRQFTAPPTLEGNTLVGYAAVFGSPSRPLMEGGRRFIETIRPGAFRAALAAHDVKALVGHDPKALLGRTKSGTLKLMEDERGLRYELSLPNTTRALDLREMIQRGDITGASFGFIVPKGGDVWTRTASGYTRDVHTADLMEISLVDDPAYEDTTVAVRHFTELEGVDAAADSLRRKRQQLAEW